jgi:hypothetical protein
MKTKLKLQIEDLDVEQFQVEDTVSTKRGTVHGQWESTGGCTMYCGESTNANTEPCLLCPNMPITYSCEDTPCC